MKQLETRMDNLEIGLRQIQVEASCYRAENAATVKGIKEACAATRKGIQEECNKIGQTLADLNHKLHDLLILMSKKFQISLPVELLSRSTAKPIPTEAGILPNTFSLQKANESAELDR